MPLITSFPGACHRKTPVGAGALGCAKMPGDGLWEYGGLHQGHINGLFCVDRGGIKQGQRSIFLVNKEGPKPFLSTGPVAAILLWAQNQDCTSRPLLNAAS